MEGKALRPRGGVASVAPDVDGIPPPRLGGTGLAPVDGGDEVPIGDELEEAHLVQGNLGCLGLLGFRFGFGFGVIICGVFVGAVVIITALGGVSATESAHLISAGSEGRR